jgi:hypothetical protein
LLLAQCHHSVKCSLLFGVRDEPAVDHIEPERSLATAVDALSGEVALDVSNPLANAIPLVLRDCGQDRKDKVRNAIAAHVAAEIDPAQADALVLEFLDERAKRIASRRGLRGPPTDG